MLLAAGLGTRLRPLTYEVAKPMVPVLGRPVMDHILRLLAQHGFDDVIANLHYFPPEPFVDWAQDVFPVLLEQDVPFYGHEIADYWNDIGNVKEFRQGNFDALEGVVRVELDPGRVNPADIDGIEDPPVYVGQGS